MTWDEGAHRLPRTWSPWAPSSQEQREAGPPCRHQLLNASHIPSSDTSEEGVKGETIWRGKNHGLGKRNTTSVNDDDVDERRRSKRACLSHFIIIFSKCPSVNGFFCSPPCLLFSPGVPRLLSVQTLAAVLQCGGNLLLRCFHVIASDGVFV